MFELIDDIDAIREENAAISGRFKTLKEDDMQPSELFDIASSLALAQATAVQAGAAMGSRSSLLESREAALNTGNTLLALARQIDAVAREQFNRAQRIAEQLGAP